MADPQTNRNLIFSYGTLKQNFQNSAVMKDLILQNDAVYLGTCITNRPYPLVVGPWGIPYLINLAGTEGSHRVKGELYAVSKNALLRLDNFEGTSTGHYERFPIEVMKEENDAVLVKAEAYFANRKFGERLWEKRGKVGLVEYSDGTEYVRVENRPENVSFLDAIEMFLSDSS